MYEFIWIHSKLQVTIWMGHENQGPKIELAQGFMPVLITSIFDDDSIKNECASMEIKFPIISLWEIC